jgi:hypothetical protein
MDTNERELRLMQTTPGAWRGAALQVCISVGWQASGSRERLLALFQPMASPIRVHSCPFAVVVFCFLTSASVATSGRGLLGNQWMF